MVTSPLEAYLLIVAVVAAFGLLIYSLLRH